jgi:hypothetical protein
MVRRRISLFDGGMRVGVVWVVSGAEVNPVLDPVSSESIAVG